MNRWEARDLLLERDPVRALRADRVDPLPPRPKPCTCSDEEKEGVYVLEQMAPVALFCVGRCQ